MTLIIFDFYIVPRLNEKDFMMIHKSMQYSKNAYEEAVAAREAAVRTENVINEFIKKFNDESEKRIINSDCNEQPIKGYGKKKQWYTVSVIYIYSNSLLFYILFSNNSLPLNLEYIG